MREISDQKFDHFTGLKNQTSVLHLNMLSTLAYRRGIYLPKDQIRIEPDDLGFERGFAVFDYCRERNGSITFLKDHLDRLAHSQTILNFKQPVAMQEVKDILLKLQSENALVNSYFKILLSARI